MSKHTPMPWTFSAVPGDNYVMASEGHNKVAICQLMGWPGITPEELDANKRIIATAPWMLRALKSIVAVLDGRQPKDIPGAIMAAQAAIELAEGVQQ